MLPAGSWVCCYIGEVINQQETNRRISSGVGDYIAQLDQQLNVDALPYGGLARFINHSTNLSSQIRKTNGRLRSELRDEDHRRGRGAEHWHTDEKPTSARGRVWH